MNFLMKLIAFGEVSQTGMQDFVNGVVQVVTSQVTLADIALIVAGIIGAGIVAIFAWKFARKGFTFVKNALSGKGGRV